jgi:hypothetical protein
MNSNIRTLMLAAAATGLLDGTTAAHASVLAPSGTSPILKAGEGILQRPQQCPDTEALL